MKLLTRYNRINIIATIVVLLISAICYYYVITSVLLSQLDKDLKIEEQEILDFIKENNRMPDPTFYVDEQEEFIPSGEKNIPRKFRTVTIFNKEENENISYRQLEFPLIFSGTQYKILVRKSEEETDDLIRLILTITLGILLILLVTLFFINRFLLSKLWKPFNVTLQQLKQFNLSGTGKVKLPETDIREFSELNDAVTHMTKQVSTDYNEVKAFTENASHEIQTPLAIIKSKLELLSQTDYLKENEMDTIQSIYEAANRLSRLNQSLILLTKIDNDQFTGKEEVDISSMLKKHLYNYEELIAAKSISGKTDIADNIKLNINEALAEILISNLITNAVKHNIDNGIIEITLSSNSLSVSNTGLPLENAASELFERFKKDNISSDSLGLGLSIVKKICDKYNFKIHYSYSGGLHTNTVDFR